MILSEAIRNKLELSLNTGIININPVGGGCINKAYRIFCKDKQVFVKINAAHKFPLLFHKEKNGLLLLSRSGAVNVPGVIAVDEVESNQVLILEWIDKGTPDALFWASFGEQLAALHDNSMPFFGLDEDNFMGSVPQINTPKPCWCQFFIENRLDPVLKKCLAANLLLPIHRDLLGNLYKRLPGIFDDGPSALVHGDLWSGNFLCDAQGRAVLIDPAVYYGHRAVDLGMTRLFGGFDQIFYESYHYHAPLSNNHEEQWEVCNLYPLMIHLLLFGKSYLPAIECVINKYR